MVCLYNYKDGLINFGCFPADLQILMDARPLKLNCSRARLLDEGNEEEYYTRSVMLESYVSMKEGREGGDRK